MPIQVICETCGKPFNVPPSRFKYDPPRFCSPACFYKWSNGRERVEHVDTACEYCGKPMHVLANDRKDGHGRFCSRSCAARARTKPTRHVQKVKRTCLHCGKDFFLYPSQLKKDRGDYCSKRCAYNGRKMPQRKQYIECTCRACGKVFLVMPHVVKRGNRGRFCSAQCRGAATAAKMGQISPTSIERAIRDELDKRKAAYVFQYHLLGFVIDFAFVASRLAVEADGTYWHNLPGVKEKDARRDASLAAAGWTVLRLTESEINASPAHCVDQILDHLT